MGREIPRDVDVMLNESEVGANRAQVEHVAELARFDDVAHLEHRRAVLEGVTYHQHAAVVARDADQLGSLRRRHRQRLFHQHRLARHQRLLGQRKMGADGSRDHQAFDLAIAKQLVEAAGTLYAGIQAADVIAPFGVEVTGHHPPRLPELMKIADPVGPPITQTDDADTADFVLAFLTLVILARRNTIGGNADRTQSHHFTHDPRSLLRGLATDLAAPFKITPATGRFAARSPATVV